MGKGFLIEQLEDDKKKGRDRLRGRKLILPLSLSVLCSGTAGESPGPVRTAKKPTNARPTDVLPSYKITSIPTFCGFRPQD